MYRFVLPSTLHIDDWSTDKVSFELHWDGKYRKEFYEIPDENFHEKIEIVDWDFAKKNLITFVKIRISPTFCNDFLPLCHTRYKLLKRTGFYKVNDLFLGWVICVTNTHLGKTSFSVL